MKKSFVISSMFAKMSLFAFLVSVAFASCNKSIDSPKKPSGEQGSGQDYVNMSVEEFENIIADKTKINNYTLVDVRNIDDQADPKNPYEYQSYHVFCGISIPFHNTNYLEKEKAKDETAYTDEKIFDSKLIDGLKDKNVILQCKTKGRSPRVAKILKKRGFQKLFLIYGANGYKDAIPSDEKGGADAGKKYKEENFTRIPAILTSQIADIQNAKVLDVRSKDEFDKGHYMKGTAQAAENITMEGINNYTITKDSRIVVMAANAIDAYTAAKALAKKLRNGEKLLHLDEGFINNKTLLTNAPIRICVEPAK